MEQLKPSAFLVQPWGSVCQKSEAETVALNVVKILNRTGNEWRKITFEEYRDEREKDGDFYSMELGYFDKVRGYLIDPNTAALFSPAWAEIAEQFNRP